MEGGKGLGPPGPSPPSPPPFPPLAGPGISSLLSVPPSWSASCSGSSSSSEEEGLLSLLSLLSLGGGSAPRLPGGGRGLVSSFLGFRSGPLSETSLQAAFFPLSTDGAGAEEEEEASFSEAKLREIWDTGGMTSVFLLVRY